MDKRANRQLIAELLQQNIKDNNREFPQENSFIEHK